MIFKLNPTLANDTFPIGCSDLCEWRLMNDAQYPWIILVPQIDGATEIIDLSTEQQTLLLSEINAASQVLKTLCNPDKLNIGALGNLVPQLHIHCIARYQHDPCWPKPIWGQLPPKPYTTGNKKVFIKQLHSALENQKSLNFIV